ncbi:phage N-6-adenine-methyltransferase [Escherichia coli]|nr:phage N-6-adenine-methyltransferase [Escherichia coli]
MTTLTQCQQQVLDMLISYQKERGFPPTNQEVATMLGYRSVNAAVEHLRALEKKGVITIKRGQHEGQYITGMRYIMKHASAMRDKGGRYVFLIKAATSEVWWPEDADHIAFIRGRIGFELPAWFIPKDEKQVPTGAFFAGAIAVFDKTWKGPAISYIGRDELEACGEAFLAQVRQQAEKLVREMAA